MCVDSCNCCPKVPPLDQDLIDIHTEGVRVKNVLISSGPDGPNIASFYNGPFVEKQLYCWFLGDDADSCDCCPSPVLSDSEWIALYTEVYRIYTDTSLSGEFVGSTILNTAYCLVLSQR